MQQIIIPILAFLLGLAIGYILSIKYSKRNFIVNIDDKGVATIEPENKENRRRVEFWPDMNKDEIEEENRPGPLKKFLSKFKKVEKVETENDLL